MRTARERFLKMVDVSPGCWNWTGWVNGGYGYFRNENGKCVNASRYAWELANDMSIPENCSILHKCKNPLCVNPNHLVIRNRKYNSSVKLNRKHKEKLIKEARSAKRIKNKRVKKDPLVEMDEMLERYRKLVGD